MFRPRLQSVLPRPAGLILLVFAVHAAIRFGGLRDPILIPLSMAIIWPLPWLLSDRSGRRRIGLRAPTNRRWFVFGPVAALGALALCIGLAWGVFGEGAGNWFTRHALALHGSLVRMPPEMSPVARFWAVTGPAMIFSPLAEEFLFRGYMMAGFATSLGEGRAMLLQAAAFAFVHLAHYGLSPLQPGLIAVWLPSMFAVALVLGWIVRRSGSLWPAVLAHAVFNLGMNAAVFRLLPDLVN